jgi:hypothetical protein
MTTTEILASAGPDAQEALSLRWGGGAIALLPLSSGRWAVFADARNTSHRLVAIMEEEELTQSETLERLKDWSQEGKASYRARRQAEQHEAETKGTRQVAQSMEDLGL